MQRQSKISTRRMLAHAMHSTVSRVPSRRSSFVLIGLLALLAASCRTAKTTQTEQTHQKVEASASQDSSASLSQQVESLKVVTVVEDRWTEQAWIITPLPDGSVELKGKTHEQRKADSTVTVKAETRQRQTATVNKRRREEDKNDVRTTSKHPPNEVASILLIWLTGIVALVGIGYYLVKRQNKEKNHG